MSVYIFAKLFYLLVLFLLMCGTLCGQVCAGGGTHQPESNTVELFKKEEKQITTAFKPDRDEKASQVTVEDYYLPILVSTRDIFVALAGVKRNNEIKKNITILTKYIENEDLSKQENVAETLSSWKMRFAVEAGETDNTGDLVKGLLAVANKEKIYLLLVNHTKKNSAPLTNIDWVLNLVVGEVNEDVSVGKKVLWRENLSATTEVTRKFKQEFKETQLVDSPFSGSAFLTNDNKTLFALVMESAAKKMFVLIKLKDGAEELEFVYSGDAGSCYPYFFAWGDKIFMIPVSCVKDNEKKIIESSNMGKAWENSTGGFFRQYGFLKDKKHFTTTKIGDKSLLLFIEEKKTEVNLWMSDGNRSTKIEAITTIESTKTFYGSILHTENGLFVLYQKYKAKTEAPKEINCIFFTKLKEPLEEITKTLDAWNKSSEYIQKLCEKTDITVTPCSTDGLVGFLLGTKKDSITPWEDKYFNINTEHIPEPNGDTTMQNGFKFNGGNAVSKWLENKLNEDQPYNFTDPGFTLVTIVTIDKNVENSDNSLLGVSLSEDTKHVGLWCSDGKWAVSTGNGPELRKTTKNCVQGKPYSVALVLKDRTFSVYVDWEELTELKGKQIKIMNEEKPKYFYFGADAKMVSGKKVESHVSVSNVFLYNRPFEGDEIDNLKKQIKKPVSAETPVEAVETDTHEDEKIPTPMPQDTDEKTEKREKEEKAPSPSRTEDGGVGGSVRVFSLLLAVLCVSAPLLHL